MKKISNKPSIEKTKIIASSNNTFNIELVEHLGNDSVEDIINISKDLKKIYGPNSFLDENNIHKYFNEKTLPFIARYQNKISFSQINLSTHKQLLPLLMR